MLALLKLKLLSGYFWYIVWVLFFTVLIFLQVMAVDIHSWAQSRAPWPLRTIPAPTPVTPGVSGGSVCQKAGRCDYCWGILTLRVVQAAAMALC